MAGAPLGNQNAAKGKIWQAAIMRALEKRGSERKAAIDDLAERLLAKADEGDISALKELGDRLEGKPAQAIIGGAEDDPPIKQSLTVAFKGLPDAGR